MRPVTAGLALALLAGAAARAARWLLSVEVVEIDGAWYLRLAESLRAGTFEGLVPGPEVMFPPLYPAGIAVLSAAGVEPVVAGRALSLAAGLLSIVLVWVLARRTAGPRAGTAAAWFVALAPGPIAASVAVFPEAVHGALLLSALVVLAGPATRTAAALAGGLTGLAYLVRVETLPLVAWTASWLLVFGWVDRAGVRRRAPALVFLAVCLLGTLPFAWHLKQVTGTWRLEGKGGRVSTALALTQEGATFREAHFAVDADGREVGAFLSLRPVEGPGLAVLDPRRAGYWIHPARGARRLGEMAATGHTWLSPLLLPVLLLAFRRPLRSGRVDGLLLGWVLAALAAFVLYRPAVRYLVPLAVPFALWSGRVLATLEGRWRRVPVALLAAVLALSTARSLVTGMSELDESRGTHPDVRVLGRVLRDLPGEGGVMSDDARVAYFAGRPWAPMPIAPDWDVVLAFARRKGARWIHVGRFTREEVGPPPPGLVAVPEGAGVLFVVPR